MRYLLALLTHGTAPHLGDTLQSFRRWVQPAPTKRLAVVDGSGTSPDVFARGDRWHVIHTYPQVGFCDATRLLWEVCRGACEVEDLQYVLWLENDFRFLRPTRLDRMAQVLDRHPVVAQMALMRQPVNAKEIKAGSLVAANPGLFHYRLGWMEHNGFWTTNPSLIPYATLRDYEWPDDGKGQCEGRFGITLRSDARTFGYWGDGDTWVEHLGVRDGTGKGY